VEVPSFTVEAFLLSALVDFPEVNSKGEKKEEQVRKYASLLVEAELADEKTLSKLTEERLEKLGIPLGHAVAIAEAAQSYGKAKEPKTKKVRNLREFYANGHIKQEESCFFINPEQSNQRLIKCIEQGFYVLLQGVRGSGKTTRSMYAIKHQLPKYCALYVSLQSLEYSDPQSFWTTFTKCLLQDNRHKIHTDQVTLVKNAEGFKDLFTKPELFEEGKRVVIFLDEFDLLLYGREEVRTSFLDALRFLKENRETRCLHSVVGVGPLKIIDVVKDVKVSPFNFGESITTPKFTMEDTKALFLQFCDDYGVQISDETIQDIFERTGGHPGHTCMCGKEIQESLLRGKLKLDHKDWLKFAVYELPGSVSYRWKIGSQLRTRLDDNCQKLLLNYFLATESRKIKLSDSNAAQIAIDLSAVGVLTGEPSTNEFWIPSPLIRAVIWSSLSISGQLSVPPPIYNGLLDVVAVIKTGLPLFSRDTMVRAPDVASKENRDTGTEVKFKDPVPNEHVYQVELVLLLRKWLSDRLTWEIDTEADAEGSDSCDIVITKEKRLRYVLELVAHTTPYAGKAEKGNSLEGHYNRAQDYHNALAANETWIINFTTRHPSKGYIWPEKSLQVCAIHVYHKLDWTEARIVTSPDDKEGMLIKLI